MKLKIGERELNLVKSPMSGNRLPKRSNGTVNVVLDGAPFVAPVTNNRAWSKTSDTWLDYVWVTRDGVAYYATLDYTESAQTLAGAELQIADGVAERKDPARVTSRTEVETLRITKFKNTWTARHGA
jgi:hypothetical protein